MEVLVDSSVWIDYFQSAKRSSSLDILIEENIIVTNDLILAELIPVLRIQKQPQLIQLLSLLPKLHLAIQWQEVIEFQISCLRHGLNGVGVADLIIIQNALQNKVMIYSLDKHFPIAEKFFHYVMFR